MVLEEFHHVTLSIGGNLTHRHIGNALHAAYLTSLHGTTFAAGDQPPGAKPLPEPPEKDDGHGGEEHGEPEHGAEEEPEGKHFGQGWHLPGADWHLAVKVGRPPPGMEIPPHDHAEKALKAKMRELAKAREMEADAMRKAQQMLEAEGRGPPGGLDKMPMRTPSEIAQQLQQSGDYGNGLPYIIDNPPVEPFKKPLPAHALPTKTVALGASKSVEFIECWTGQTRVRCPWDPPPPRRCDSAMPISALMLAYRRRDRRKSCRQHQGKQFL